MLPYLTNFSLLIIFVILSNKLTNEALPHCKVYTDNSETKCSECDNNFLLLNGRCPCYDRNCEECSSSYFGGCSKCKANFLLNPTINSCMLQIPHCLFYNEYGCTFCETDYSLRNNTCVLNQGNCNGYCLYCYNNEPGSCRLCNPHYNLIDGGCVFNQSCSFFYQGGLCSASQCEEGYYFNGQYCIKECFDADIMDNECLTCNNRSYLTETLNCRPKDNAFEPHCAMFRKKETGYCDRCDIGYYLTFGRCEKCKIENCLICDYDNGEACNSCMDGFELIDGKCVENSQDNIKTNNINIENCVKQYNNNDVSYCFQCNDGFSRVSGACIPCNVNNCVFCLDNNTCAQCKDNFVLTSTGTCNEDRTGSKCLEYDNYLQECVFCQPFYKLVDGECILDPKKFHNDSLTYDTIQCSGNNCKSLECPDYQFYSPENGTCMDCPEGCLYCFDQEDYGCSACADGYDFYYGFCLQLVDEPNPIDHCREYDRFGFCARCKSNCYLVNDGSCDCFNLGLILIICFSVVIVALLVVIAVLLFQRRKRQRVMLQAQRELQKKLEEEKKLIDSMKVSDELIKRTEEIDKTIPPCSKCQNEKALLIVIPCKCRLCEECFNELERIIFEGEQPDLETPEEVKTENKLDEKKLSNQSKHSTLKRQNSKASSSSLKKKESINLRGSKMEITGENQSIGVIKADFSHPYLLPPNQQILLELKGKKCYCKKEIEQIKFISKKCDVCFEITSATYHFKCNCTYQVCAGCFNTLLEKKEQCPQCRADILRGTPAEISMEKPPLEN